MKIDIAGMTPAPITDAELRERLSRIKEEEVVKGLHEIDKLFLEVLVPEHGLFEALAGLRLAFNSILILRCRGLESGQLRIVIEELDRQGFD